MGSADTACSLYLVTLIEFGAGEPGCVLLKEALSDAWEFTVRSSI